MQLLADKKPHIWFKAAKNGKRKKESLPEWATKKNDLVTNTTN